MDRELVVRRLAVQAVQVDRIMAAVANHDATLNGAATHYRIRQVADALHAIAADLAQLEQSESQAPPEEQPHP